MTFASRLRRITTSGRYIPEIDGLRFIAIAAVVGFHLSESLVRTVRPAMASTAAELVHATLGLGHFGVELFFVISGFILGLPFAAHRLQGGAAVPLGSYYRRRLTRLEPPYLAALLLFFGIAAATGDRDIGEGSYLSQLLLRAVYGYGLVHHEHSLLNGVTWSLEIEVQFYLLVPLLVQVYRLPAAARRTLLVAAMVAAAPLSPGPPELRYSLVPFVGYFLGGLLLADLHATGHLTPPGRAPGSTLLATLLAGVALACMSGPPQAWRLLPFVLAAFCAASLRSRSLRALLGLEAICLTGGMCYSIYLLHWPLVSFMTSRLAGAPLPASYLPRLAIHAAVMLPLIAAASLVFYVLVERPCMDPRWPWKLRNRILDRTGRRQTA